MKKPKTKRPHKGERRYHDTHGEVEILRTCGYAATVEDELLTIRPNMSGSGGWWFIQVVGGSYRVFETDQYGGDSYHLQDFESISDALELANSLA